MSALAWAYIPSFGIVDGRPRTPGIGGVVDTKTAGVARIYARNGDLLPPNIPLKPQIIADARAQRAPGMGKDRLARQRIALPSWVTICGKTGKEFVSRLVAQQAFVDANQEEIVCRFVGAGAIGGDGVDVLIQRIAVVCTVVDKDAKAKIGKAPIAPRPRHGIVGRPSQLAFFARAVGVTRPHIENAIIEHQQAAGLDPRFAIAMLFPIGTDVGAGYVGRKTVDVGKAQAQLLGNLWIEALSIAIRGVEQICTAPRQRPIVASLCQAHNLIHRSPCDPRDRIAHWIRWLLLHCGSVGGTSKEGGAKNCQEQNRCRDQKNGQFSNRGRTHRFGSPEIYGS